MDERGDENAENVRLLLVGMFFTTSLCVQRTRRTQSAVGKRVGGRCELGEANGGRLPQESERSVQLGRDAGDETIRCARVDALEKNQLDSHTESEQREKAALARRQQEVALVTAKPGTMQYAQQTAKATEMSLMRVHQTTTTYTFVPKEPQSDASKALGGDRYVVA